MARGKELQLPKWKLLQCDTVCYSATLSVTLRHSLLQCDTVCYTATLSVTLRHSLLQCDTVCYSATLSVTPEKNHATKVMENQFIPSVNCRNKEVYLKFREYINATVKRDYSKMWIPELLHLAGVGVWEKLWFRRRNKLPWHWIEYIFRFIFSKFHNDKEIQNINMIVSWRSVSEVTTTHVLVIFSLQNFRIKIF